MLWHDVVQIVDDKKTLHTDASKTFEDNLFCIYMHPKIISSLDEMWVKITVQFVQTVKNPLDGATDWQHPHLHIIILHI